MSFHQGRTIRFYGILCTGHELFENQSCASDCRRCRTVKAMQHFLSTFIGSNVHNSGIKRTLLKQLFRSNPYQIVIPIRSYCIPKTISNFSLLIINCLHLFQTTEEPTILFTVSLSSAVMNFDDDMSYADILSSML